MKRFYKLVTIQPREGGYALHLDARPVKTPSGKILLAPNENFATALQGEWAAQIDNIIPETMPLTQMMSTQIDQVSEQRASMSASILNYLDTDLLCYRAGELPPGIQEAQAAQWDPWLTWFEKRFGRALETTTGLTALMQAAQAHDSVQSHVHSFNDAEFTVLQIVVPMTGSLVLGLAFIDGTITPEQVYNAARVEENFKAKLYNEAFYGPDPAQEKKDAAMLRDLEAAAQFLKLTSAK
jgi:chaperone required for assembly of F1-ATPase